MPSLPTPQRRIEVESVPSLRIVRWLLNHSAPLVVKRAGIRQYDIGIVSDVSGNQNNSRRGTGVLILSRERIACERRAVRRAPFALLLVFVVASAFAKSTAPEVIFISPYECLGFHGKNRWIAKTDLTPVPLDKSAIQSVTPSQIYAWEGLAADVDLTHMVEARIPSEEKCPEE